MNSLCGERSATNGKSRAFINDSPVTLDLLQELADQLIDLHQQFDTLAMHKQKFQQEAIDALANITAAVTAYKGKYVEYKALEKKLNEWQKKAREANKEADFLQFQLKELTEAKLVEGEQQEAESQLEKLTNAEEIKRIATMAASVLEEDDRSLIDKITEIGREFSSIAGIDTNYQNIYDRLQSVIEELRDIAAEAGDVAENMDFDAEATSQLQERLNLLYRLQKKHGVNDMATLIAIRDDLAGKLKGFQNSDEAIASLQAEMETLKKKLLSEANEISIKRKKALPDFEKKINDLLVLLAMPNARLKVGMNTLQALSPTGLDDIQFLFATNKGSDFLPLKDIASGGELARLTLCLKSVIADKMQLPTMIFDEIDTGVSGEVAARMGNILKSMASAHQLISITHSPQIAAKADRHYFVYKSDGKDRTVSMMKVLDDEQRVVEIAKMLSGEQPGKAAMDNAKELIYGK